MKNLTLYSMKDIEAGRTPPETRRLYTGNEMGLCDRTAAEHYGIDPALLMENAGLAAAQVIHESLSSGRRSRSADGWVYIFCGTGNNGGDGFTAARHLRCRGYRIKVILAGAVEKLKGEAAANHRRLQAMEDEGLILSTPPKPENPSDLFAPGPPAALVDSLFGTGLNRPPAGQAAGLIRLMNQEARNRGCPVIALDIPSGIQGDTGASPPGGPLETPASRETPAAREQGIPKEPSPWIQADITVTFGGLKRGLLLYPGRQAAGQVYLAPISFPPGLPKAALPEADRLILRLSTPPQRPPRLPWSHKGSFGKLLILAGSRDYPGASLLAARAALRSGCGYVHLALPEELRPLIAPQQPELLLHGLPQDPEGRLSPAAQKPLLDLAASCDAVVLGPGLTASPGTRQLLSLLIPRIPCPVVLDADALDPLLEEAAALLDRPKIITPHPGEAGRLLGRRAAAIQKNRPQAASELARRWKATVILKGAGTLIAAPNRSLAGGTDILLNTTGNNGMGTAGSGDVLAGLTGALLAQGIAAEEAAPTAVWLHGRAGDLARDKGGEEALIAGEIINFLGTAFLSLSSSSIIC